MVWLAADREMKTDWQELHFLYTSNNACDDELQNAEVMHQAGLHEVDRARREAIRHNNRGDLQAARVILAAPAVTFSPYAQNDTKLQEELKLLDALDGQLETAPMAPAMAKELYYQQQRRSRNQKDLRQSEQKNGIEEL